MKNTMKRIGILIMLMALVVFTISCDDVVQPPHFAESDATITITASSPSVAVAAADSLKDAISFDWTDPQYSSGLKNSKFTIMVGASDKNFTNFSSKSFSGELNGSLLGKEVNGMALKQGGSIGQPIVLDVKLVSSQVNNNETKNSNVLKITVTPYGDLTLTSSLPSIVTDPTKASETGVTFNWNTAFNGFNGVKTYQLQYAKTGTSFETPTTVAVSGFSKSFTQLELNTIALSYDIAPSSTGDVEFRIKATNELNTVLYSNTYKLSITPYVAINSVGIIGDATQGGWDIDTDLYRPDLSKPSEWTAIVYLIGGKEVLFRPDDKFDSKWGVGGQGGSNIPIANSGYYKVNLNVASGVYSFTPVTTQVYNNVGLIGDQSSWTTEIDNLTQDPNNDQLWTGTVALTAGELKFKANQDWAFNWGPATDATKTDLSGYGVKDGKNIVIPADGDYFVSINVATGDYFFGKPNRNVPYTDIGLIGDGTPNGWGTDTDLIRNPSNPFRWSGKMSLTSLEAKFRADNGWAVNWGALSFPKGTGSQDGSNIKITEDGTYQITFNSATGEYTFTK
jgi:hypothetical protein